jgi:hypothetical protein
MVLQQLCDHDWDPGAVGHLASVVLDIPLDEQQLKLVLEASCHIA